MEKLTKDTQRYRIKDIESGENSRVDFWASEESLIPLPPADIQPERSWIGLRVLARYPETTAFYPGRVADMVSNGYIIYFDGDGHEMPEVMVEAKYVLMHSSQL